jgi:cytokinesis protein
MNWQHLLKLTEVLITRQYLIGNLMFTCLIVNLQDIRKSLNELRDGLKQIQLELNKHFDIGEVANLPADDRYAKKMWRFVGEAEDSLADLLDAVTLAEGTFADVLKYYGEDDKNVSSAEFYGIFKTFLTSYKVSGFPDRFFDNL